MSNILIYGAGKSGNSLYQLLCKNNNVSICDDKIMPNTLDILQAKQLLVNTNQLIVSPGVPLDSPLCVLAHSIGVEVIGEFEFSARRCKGKMVAITGTNGKTTVTELIHHILDCAKVDNLLLGNVGTPFSSMCDTIKEDQIVVLEASSFQLENCYTFKPYISAITNITPDHINRHHTFENYVKAKSNVMYAQNSNDFGIVNLDDERVKKLYENSPVSKKYFSVDNHCDCYYDHNHIICGNNSIKIDNVKYYYKHSISNLLLAVQICDILGVKSEIIEEAIDTFVSDKHRIEYIANINNVKFYDDSKGTNIASTLSAISQLNNVNLILGGSDKGYEFDDLFSNIKNVDFIATIGFTSKKIFEASQRANFTNIVHAVDLSDAVSLCYQNAVKNNGVVLLSPACASFDMFNNYEHRGEVFAEIVRQLQQKQKN